MAPASADLGRSRRTDAVPKPQKRESSQGDCSSVTSSMWAGADDDCSSVTSGIWAGADSPLAPLTSTSRRRLLRS
eukprot:4239944-Prorocentrum_lima.AAC.1